MRAIFILLISCAAVEAQQPTQAPKRTLTDSQMQKKNAQAPAPSKDPGSSAYDALAASTENLNTIRDSNVRRLGEGCSPDVAARIGEIRTQLGIKSAPARKDPAAEAAMLTLAANWYKAADAAPSAPRQKPSDLLDSVLPGSSSTAAVAQDAASLQTEMNRLLASCSADGAKR